ncbi:MAG TPA: AmmeMemoRadiSam system protein A [Thermoanaerobaculia bacterium]|nr:AmmeMemoRadiSam system protein A [Thermoanaerobaculia bacterium]
MSGTESQAPAPADEARGRVLLAIARESLREAFEPGVGTRATPPDAPWLREPGATFVTLERDGELRGCVGSIHAYRPLGEDVRANARAAAFADHRFPPLAAWELPQTAIEVSLLSPPEPLDLPPPAGEAEALAALRPGVDGLILECGQRRGTFLPQVWEQLPGRREFLDQLLRKVGLPAGFWSPEIRLFRYTVASWQEHEERSAAP